MALISCTANTQLICAFVFTYAISRFSRDAAQILKHIGKRKTCKKMHGKHWRKPERQLSCTTYFSLASSNCNFFNNFKFFYHCQSR